MEAIIARHARVSAGYETNIPRLKVARVTEPVPPTMHVAEASLCICVRGSRTLSVGQAAYAQDETHYLLSAVGLPTVVAIENASTEKPYTALRVDLDLDLARQVMVEIDARGIGPPPETQLAFGAIDRNLLEAVARLVRLIEAPDDVEFIGDLAHRELLYRLLRSPSGHKLRQIAQLGSQGNRAANAVNWLREHFQERLRIEELAAIAGMSVSTLHRHFHNLTGLSPIQYQKQLRLHEARRRMLDIGADVGTTALEVGYESTTQFIREYRRLFGNPPLRDVNALRTHGERQQIL